MRVPVEWLKELTDIEVTAAELAERMTKTGIRVSEVISSGGDITGVYTGRITEVREHPDSDHLKIVSADLGSDELGHDLQIVCGAPNVREGMICPVAVTGAVLPGHKIKKTRMRGVESFGMCCSADELGLSPEDLEGADEYGLWDMPEDTPVGRDIKEILGIGSAVLVLDVPSGRPDCRSVEGIAREAAATLGKGFRPVTPHVTEDGTRDISGIDGIRTEVLDGCVSYFARAAEDVADGPSPAWMRDRLAETGTESSGCIADIINYVRLELGYDIRAVSLEPDIILFETTVSREEAGYLDPAGARRAVDRAAELFTQLGAGRICKGSVSICEAEQDERVLVFDPGRINSFLGISASREYMERILSGLGCVIDGDTVKMPSFRPDLDSEADIAGEIARFYGYDEIGASVIDHHSGSEAAHECKTKIREKIRDTLVSCGYYEAITVPFDEDTSDLRTAMLPSMVRTALLNNGRGVSEAKVFELGSVYPEGTEVCEMLAGFSYSNLPSVSGADQFYEVKGMLEELAKVLGIRSVTFESRTEDPFFHPGRTADVIINGRPAGVAGCIHPDMADELNCPSKICFFEADARILIESSNMRRTYKPLPRYPGIVRDLTVTVPKITAVGGLIKACRTAGGRYLREVEFFDVREDSKKGEELKTVSLSLVFSADDRAISESDINSSMGKIIERLEKDFCAKLR